MKRLANLLSLISRGLLAVLLCGSSGSNEVGERDFGIVRTDDSRDTEPVASTIEEYDFGPVLACGETLHHKFVLRNPTSSRIRVLNATPMTPCCSAVGPIPEFIPPGGTATVPASLKPGFEAGRKRVRFVVKTDEPQRPILVLALTAAVATEIDITGEDARPSLLMGRSGNRTLRVTCRRIGDVGRRAPESVKATGPITASFAGSLETRGAPGGLIEETRVLSVAFPASSEPQAKHAEIRLRWADGFEKSHVIAWRVDPHIRAVPPGFVLNPGSEHVTKTLHLRSADRPFRIIKITGPSLAENPNTAPSDSSTSHKVSLILNAAGAGASDIQFITDHPDQPAVTVSC